MARVTYVKKAQARFETVPVIDPATGQPKTIPVVRKDGTPKKTKSGREVIRRLTVEDHSKPLPNRRCDKCGTEIKVGDPYKWIKPKSGPYGGSKRVRCAKCPTWRASETTSSAALSCVYAAQEAAEDALGNWDRESLEDLQAILNDAAEGIREGAEVYRESAQNMEDGFGHSTSTSEDLEMKADDLESQADDLDSAADDLEEWDEDEAIEEIKAESGEDESYDWDADPEGHLGDLDVKKDAWADDQVSKVEDALGNVGV